MLTAAARRRVDVYAKLIADHMAKTLHRTIVIEHKPGGSGNTGLQYAAHEPADGNLIIVTTQGMTEINPVAYADTRWSLADFIPLIRGAGAAGARRQSRHSGEDGRRARAWVRKNPGKLSYSSYGAGRSSHFLGFLFNKRFGLDLDLALQGGPRPGGRARGQPHAVRLRPAAADVAADQGQEAQRHRRHEPRALALLPRRATFAELGQPDFTTNVWFGLMLRSGTPPAMADAILAAAKVAHEDPGVRAKLEAQGFDISGETGPAFAAEIRSQTARWARLVAARFPQRSRRRELTARPRRGG